MSNRSRLIFLLALAACALIAPHAAADNYVGVALPLGTENVPFIEGQYHLDHVMALEGRMEFVDEAATFHARLKYRLNLDGGLSVGLLQAPGFPSSPAVTIGIWGDMPLRDWRTILHYAGDYAFNQGGNRSMGRIGVRHSLNEQIYIGASASFSHLNAGLAIVFGMHY